MKPKILLLTDVQPSKNYSGALVSLQCVKYLLEEKYDVFCVTIKSKSVVENLDDEVSSEINTLVLQKPDENHENRDDYNNKIKELIKQTYKYIKDNKINIILCPIQGETILKVLIGVNRISKIPYVAQVWDPIEWVLDDLKYSEEEKERIVKAYYRCLKKAQSVLSASHSMAKYFINNYNIKSLPLYSSFEFPLIESKNNSSQKEYIILMSGQTYAEKGLNSLFGALEKMNWEYKGKKIIFKYYGSNNPKIFNNEHVIKCGYVDQKVLMEEETKATVLYCPYFFEDNFSLDLVSKTSFPSKIATYIPALRPIMIHASKKSSVYTTFKKYNAGYLIDTMEVEDLGSCLSKIFDNENTPLEKDLIENSKKLFDDLFKASNNKHNLFKALKLSYTNEKKYKFLEVNNVDLPGKRFNGYDLMNYINENTIDSANQIVTYKTSNNKNVLKLFSNYEQELEYKLLKFEENKMFVHSCLSVSSPSLKSKDSYKNADLVHYHLIHNTKLSLISMIDFCNEKPSIISIHDPWNFTGRCVHFGECQKWLNECHECQYLDTLFPLKKDNCSALWNLKKYVYDNIDVDYVVHSEYMLELFKKSPLLKDKRVHFISLGINVKKFNNDVITSEIARKHYGIDKDDIVLFHRAQKDFKGTNYLEEALQLLEIDKKITIITCSECGLLDSIKNKYNVIDLGNIDSEELLFAYNACDIFMMPSIGESFGLMAIEAMACSKPVIVFNNTALPKIVFAPDCGIAVENKNSEKLMEAIKYLLENKSERLKRGKLARKLVEENYNVDNYNKKMYTLYKEVMERKHTFNRNCLNQMIDDSNENVKKIKVLLNKLTSQIFSLHSKSYKELIFEDNDQISSDEIDFSNIGVQLTINDYNNKLYDIYNKLYGDVNLPIIYRGFDKIKIVRKIKRFCFLLINDRVMLKRTISRKLDKYPGLKKELKKILRKGE